MTDYDTALPRKEVDRAMHTAEHILTATLMQMFGCGRPFTTHIEKRKSKADYRMGRGLSQEETLSLENCVNEIVAADLPVFEEFLPREEAAKFHRLDRLPPDAGDRIRIIRIGTYDACPCIGPHVKSTREIGSFRIVSTDWENGTLRIRFKVGGASC